MASALGSAFQSNHAYEDEQSLKPQRAAPPVPSVAYASTVAARAPDQIDKPYQANTAQHRAQNSLQAAPPAQQYPAVPQQQYSAQPISQSPQYAAQQPQHFSRPSTQQTAYSQPQAPPTRGRQEPPEVIPPKKRSNSFSFLRRSSSQQPTTRIAQAQHQAAIAPQQQRNSGVSHQPQPSDGSITSGSTGIFRARSKSKDGRGDRNMLRKQSKMKQQQQQAELERQQRAQEAASRPPPRLPSHNPLPNIESFGGEHHNNHAYTDSQAPPAVPGTANFSRPGMASPSSPRGQSVRNSNAATNGEYYEPSGERSASMTNRGRYSYASSTAQTGNVNSPRRVRRRKDPIAFK